MPEGSSSRNASASKPGARPKPSASAFSKLPAVGHRRTREDHARETAEDYVEAIGDTIQGQGECRIKHLAQRFGVSHVTVIRVVGRLETEGLLKTQPYQPLTLTSKGKRLANACRQRHATVVAFLERLGVSAKTAAIDAEGIEHHLSAETLSAMKRFAD